MKMIIEKYEKYPQIDMKIFTKKSKKREAN